MGVVKWRDELVQMGALYWSNMVTGEHIYITKEKVAKTVKTKSGKAKTKETIEWRVHGFRPTDGQYCIQEFDTLAKAQKYATECADFINDYRKYKGEDIKWI